MHEDESQFTGEGKYFHEYAETTLKPLVGYSISEAQRNIDTHDRRVQCLFRNLPPDSRIKAVEHKLAFTLRDIRYFGIVDLVISDSDGTIRLVDYKTGKNPRIHLEQLELYSLPVLLKI